MKLVTPYAYAKLWGKSHQYVYKVIASGRIKKVRRKMPDGSYKEFIDLDKYPVPVKKDSE